MHPTRKKGDGEPASSNDAETPAQPPRWVTRHLPMAALAVSVAALLLALLWQGPGTVMTHRSRGGIMTIGATCTTYTGAELAIRVPGAGTVIVSATVGVGINHTFGVSDTARIVVSTSATDCALNNYTAFVSVPSSVMSDRFHYVTVPLLRAFPVSGAGTFTFYVNAVMDTGADATDRFDTASVVAVFYPA